MANLNNVVKLLSSDSGEKYDKPKWCLIDPCNRQGSASLCTKEFFGYGESGCMYEIKTGVVTCKNCIEIITTYHKIKL